MVEIGGTLATVSRDELFVLLSSAKPGKQRRKQQGAD